MHQELHNHRFVEMVDVFMRHENDVNPIKRRFPRQHEISDRITGLVAPVALDISKHRIDQDPVMFCLDEESFVCHIGNSASV